MRSLKFVALLLIAASLLALPSCSKKVVSRISEDSVVDLSGRWNDTDSRLVSEKMISDCLGRPWSARHWEREAKKPSVIVGTIRNESSEHIAVKTFVGDIETALINSGQVEMVGSAEEREDLRDERADQQRYSSEETMKSWGREHGADYMLGGLISTITDEEKGKKVIFYQIDLNLIHIETNEKVWQGQEKIKKFIGRKKVSM